MINCVICDRKRDEKFGHNPSPVKDEGRCCTFCNTHIVIPARMSEYIKRSIDYWLIKL